ncbi:MAG: class I tRNA ligase family protein, partial [Candidatus Saccharimonadales bacterium]|nr:class I tRNA ligase family protein [Candidatus Saccharimonadales bacterium]
MAKDAKPKKPNKHQLAQIEEQMMAAWEKENTFEKSLEKTKGGKHYEFYDGPPFANGLPHYGHVVSSIVKDAIPRYKTMRGYHVPRRFGWDCHGLPAEMKAEQDLDLGSKAGIEEYGIEKFVDYCRSSVTEFTKEWEHYVNRIGRWVDFKDNYYTMDEGYMESVMWAFKQLYDKGLVSEGFKVMPYCHVCETALSHFESRQDDSYRERTDPAVTVRFPLETGETMLAWTTTPWTLVANLALAVHKDLDYVVMEGNGEKLVLGKATVERFEEDLKGYKVIDTKKGKEFVGKSFKPPFDYYEGHPNAHVVLHADFVTVEDGTGIAHEAPGFGEEDQELTEAHNIQIVVPVDKQGNYTDK